MEVKKERNQMIYARHNEGVSFHVLAKEHGVTVTTVRDIYLQVKRDMELEGDELYCFVKKDYRLYNGLKKNGIDTKAQLLAYPREKIRYLRYIGTVSSQKLIAYMDENA